MQDITFMPANAEGKSAGEDWDAFFARTQQSGFFRGGSPMGKRWIIGNHISQELHLATFKHRCTSLP